MSRVERPRLGIPRVRLPHARKRSTPLSERVVEVASTMRFDEVLVELSAETGRSVADLEPEAIRCLNELSAEVDDKAIALWDKFGSWLTRAYDVEADASTMHELRRLDPRHSLVFLPNHRSYLDPLVLRSVLARHGFGHNLTLAGGNLRLWPLSELGNNSGIVFIRRTAKGDQVYPAMLRLYLGHLIGDHANLEWYFEGGRTRTGKLRPPKFGILRYLVDAFLAAGRDVDDVYLVPVALVYDQQHEVAALSEEETGGKKKPETLGWVYRFAMAQGLRRGQVHVRFGQPLSLREALAEAETRAGTDDLTDLVPRVAFDVAHRINAATPITPASLVAFGLLDNDERAMTLAETEALLEPFVDYIRKRGLPLTRELDLGRPEGLKRALRTLVTAGVVEEFTGGLEPVYSVPQNRKHEAAFYRNSVTHYFISRAIVELAALQAATAEPDHHDLSGVESRDAGQSLWVHALALRDLLKYEFFFPTKDEFFAEVLAEAALGVPGWSPDQVPDRAEVLELIRTSPLLIAHRVIGPFLEAYLVVADRLAALDPGQEVNQDQLITESIGVARQRFLQSTLHSPESISKDLMAGALKLADNRGLLAVGGDDVRRRRQDFADELAEAVAAVSHIRRLVLERMSDLDPETR